ncbi:MAG TPA: 16S rRNA (cytosine(1402)-N(4))-methyltransferase RsmH [bacterium]
MPHRPVLTTAVLHYLAARPGAVIADGTVGAGGHAAELAARLAPGGRLLGLDWDDDALALAVERLDEYGEAVRLIRAPFQDLAQVSAELGLPRLDGLLLDLGLSSMHVDRPERGFSFLQDGPLDMRMDRRRALTAREAVNTWPSDELAQVIREYGEDRYASRIARAIERARSSGPIETTRELAGIVAGATPGARASRRLHPATRTFQALRLAVNDELGALRTLLAALPDLLAPGGRAVIISFHSLEDRLVKRAFLDAARQGWGRVLTKKPVRPDADEVASNPRSRSAKLRALERLP